MYKCYEVPKKEIENSNKIFRPWDKNEDQDNTISTTTEETKTCDSYSDTCTSSSIKTTDIPQFNLHSMYGDYFPNLAQTLGINNTDPLFLETLSNEYAFGEYTRVINQEHQAKLFQAKKQRPKKYRCPHCDVGFSNNGQLKGHIRIHTGERPFKCDEENCGKTFTRNEELTRHKRIHSGLRPFPCSQCGKRFGRKDHLKKHCRTHMQPRGLYAVPVMLPLDTWTAAAAASTTYPFLPMFNY